MDDARELEPPAPGRRQGGVDARRSQSALHRHLADGATSARPSYLYEKVYCARGEMENRIKECQLDLFADRTSAATMRANQLRLWFASMAYVLLCALRRIGLHDTDFAEATCGTIRLKLLKIGALVRISVRRIKIRHGVGLSGRRRMGPRRTPARRRRQGPRLAGMTRAAAARPIRGNTQAHGDPEKNQIAAAPSAPRSCTPSAQPPNHLVAKSIGSVRNAG